MLKNKSLIKLLFAGFLLSAGIANAQIDVLLQKAKDKAGEVIGKKANNKVSSEEQKKNTRGIASPSSFIHGDTLLFDENFSKYKTGASAASFKTNGVAIIAAADGNKGKWMILQDKATFKLSKTPHYPKKFTVEFDILASGDNITDISPLCFGFAADNSASEYSSNTGTYVQLHYYDGDQVNIGSAKPEKFVTATYDLTGSLNQILHISLAIDEDKMAVYINSAKLADTILFSPGAAKNFYITAPWEYKNGAKVLVSNFRIAGFTK